MYAVRDPETIKDPKLSKHMCMHCHTRAHRYTHTQHVHMHTCMYTQSKNASPLQNEISSFTTLLTVLTYDFFPISFSPEALSMNLVPISSIMELSTHHTVHNARKYRSQSACLQNQATSAQGQE